jgi:ATP-dependent DNA helicase PIF1
LHGKEFQFEAVDNGAVNHVAARDKLLANCVAPTMLALKKGAPVMLTKNLTDDLTSGLLGRFIVFMSENTFDIYEVDPNPVLQTGDELKSASKDHGKIFPLVRFTRADGKCMDFLAQPEYWEVKLLCGEVQATAVTSNCLMLEVTKP